MPDDRIDAHLATCADCRTWAGTARSLPAALAAAEAEAEVHADATAGRVVPAPAVVAALLAEVAESRARPRPSGHLGIRECRIALAVLAVGQLVITWFAVLPVRTASGHMAHELTSWDIGLAAGFLFLAWQPSRAWGALPLVGFLVTCLVGASVVDLLSGAALLGRESVHLLEVAAFGCLWMLARQVPRPSVVVRLA